MERSDGLLCASDKSVMQSFRGNNVFPLVGCGLYGGVSVKTITFVFLGLVGIGAGSNVAGCVCKSEVSPCAARNGEGRMLS